MFQCYPYRFAIETGGDISNDVKERCRCCPARAAEVVLKDGGNAFDAVVAAHLAGCVVEPVLSSLGGGGYLLTHKAEGRDKWGRSKIKFTFLQPSNF